MADLPGPEKKIDWGVLLKQEQTPPTPRSLAKPLKRVRPRHRIAIMLHEAGHRPTEIASMLGMTVPRVSVILNSRHPELQQLREGFAARVASNVEDVHTRLMLHANEALDITLYHARRKTEDASNSRLAARDILYMAGFSPVKKVAELTGKVPFEDLKRIADKISEANEVVARKGEWEVREVKQA